MEKERTSGEVERPEHSAPVLPTVNPSSEKPQAPAKGGIHPAFYIALWIALSSSVILFNKWILGTLKFEFPILLTTWHLGFATIMTQIMARFTSILDSRKKVPMTGRVYLRAIVPIGVMFSLSLIAGNVTYLFLSVSFIQMLKATTPVATLLASWTMGTRAPNLRILGNVSIIVLGVIIASFGEIQFVLIGFLVQLLGIFFEAVRLTMVERLLSSAEFKMDPLVSLYYFAPACALMNGITALVVEVPKLQLSEIARVGYWTLLANGTCAFLLNVSVVFLIGRTSALALTLSGVLKDIMLVVASMMLFHDPVSGVQFFGYSIALGGLVYYKLGGEKLKEAIGDGQRAWADYGNRSPIMRKLLTIFLVLLTLFLLLGGLGNLFPQYASTEYAKSKMNTVMSGFGG